MLTYPEDCARTVPPLCHDITLYQRPYGTDRYDIMGLTVITVYTASSTVSVWGLPSGFR